MTRDEIKAVVEVGNDRRFRITFPDGVTQSVDVAAVDEEGVLHSGSGRREPKGCWTRFESIVAIERTPTHLK
jgi:hypothetical protein